jgi:hypothetical protein
LNPNVSKKKIDDTGTLPIITCSLCGAKILFISDAKVMGEAIEAHVEKHMQKSKDPAESASEAERVYIDLISQVFDTASKSQV